MFLTKPKYTNIYSISLLLTLAEASSSSNKAVRLQIPKSLRKSRTLILVPAALINNWEDEFKKWVPENSWKHLGKLRSIFSDMNTQSRLSTIEAWYHDRGVLLISYTMFEKWIHNKKTTKSAPPLSDDDHTNVQKWLLKGPRLIIADEAHHMKNIDSEISKAVTGFDSKSRVALTGSPLSNNLIEYFAMINFVAPDYLGAKEEFKARYVEPIQEGLYTSSTGQERATARKKLKALEHILEPKIHRRAIDVLKGNLPPKVEFTIKLPLTNIQRQAYTVFVRSQQSREPGKISNTQMWAWINILTLLCNHPYLFWEKMKEKDALRTAENRGAEGSKVIQHYKEIQIPWYTTPKRHPRFKSNC
jgi:SNF2 family DNA or RNA helicase